MHDGQTVDVPHSAGDVKHDARLLVSADSICLALQNVGQVAVLSVFRDKPETFTFAVVESDEVDKMLVVQNGAEDDFATNATKCAAIADVIALGLFDRSFSICGKMLFQVNAGAHSMRDDSLSLLTILAPCKLNLGLPEDGLRAFFNLVSSDKEIKTNFG